MKIIADEDLQSIIMNLIGTHMISNLIRAIQDVGRVI